MILVGTAFVVNPSGCNRWLVLFGQLSLVKRIIDQLILLGLVEVCVHGATSFCAGLVLLH